MNKMQYKDFIFPTNPAVITVHSAGRSASFFCPGYGEIVQALGACAKQISCSGSFVCASFAQAASLLAEFEEKTAGASPGVLILPGLNPMLAVLTGHSIEASGDGRVLPYTLSFTEAPLSAVGEG